jgi:hypothetical protein
VDREQSVDLSEKRGFSLLQLKPWADEGQLAPHAKIDAKTPGLDPEGRRHPMTTMPVAYTSSPKIRCVFYTIFI